METTNWQPKENQAGFTIIEMLIVLVVIAILAAIAIPNFLKARDRAKQRAAHAEIRGIATGLADYQIDTEDYPRRGDLGGGNDEAVLRVLLGPLYVEMKMQPFDPWDFAYNYESEDGSTYTLRSFGKDGLPSAWSDFDNKFNFDLDIGIVDGETVGSSDL